MITAPAVFVSVPAFAACAIPSEASTATRTTRTPLERRRPRTSSISAFLCSNSGASLAWRETTERRPCCGEKFSRTYVDGQSRGSSGEPVQRARAPRPLGAPLTCVSQRTSRLHVAPEVGGIDGLAAQRLVEPLGLSEREGLGEQTARDADEPRLVGDARPQAPEAVVDDPRVVERELREVVDRVPARLAVGGRVLRERLGRRRAPCRRSRAASRAGRGPARRRCAAAPGRPSRRRSSRAACARRSARATRTRRRTRPAARTCRAGAPRAAAPAARTAGRGAG